MIEIIDFMNKIFETREKMIDNYIKPKDYKLIINIKSNIKIPTFIKILDFDWCYRKLNEETNYIIINKKDFEEQEKYNLGGE